MSRTGAGPRPWAVRDNGRSPVTTGDPGLRGRLRTSSAPEVRGIDIEMYFDDHAPPHFHARYGGHEALIVIATGDVYAGSLPGRALRLVREWLRYTVTSSLATSTAASRSSLETIDPLP